MTDEYLDSVHRQRGDLAGLGRQETGMSLLTFSVIYLAWFIASAILGPVWIAILQRRHEHSDEAGASGDEL